MNYLLQLEQHYRQISHFNHLAAICGWDQATMMPAGGNDERSDAMAALAVHIHRLSSEPQLAEWFDQAKQQPLDAQQQASLREMQRVYRQTTVLPEDLVHAKAKAGSRCEHAWRSQRKNNDWVGFSQNFAEVVNLSQQEAQIRAEALGTSPYDAMLELYEPGINSALLDPLFDELKQQLPPLIQQISAQQHQPADFSGHYPQTQQQALGLEVMQLLGFDFNHGRLDISSHPFCGGVPSDVRITTRYDESDFVQSLMGVIHETGHARYEQGLPTQQRTLPVGQARSMGIHESQSLFFEMQLGRHPAFIAQLTPLCAKHFSNHPAARFNAADLLSHYRQVKPGFIRVDADEVTYPAHVILRYEIERDLINGVISYRDIPELWDSKMQQYLGLSTKDNYQNGCMQDIHWTDGAFGYFPSYTLGAIYAAQLMQAMRQQVDVEACIAQLQLQPIFSWLSTHIWQHGSALTTNELLQQACGEGLNVQHFIRHLQQRYLSA